MSKKLLCLISLIMFITLMAGCGGTKTIKTEEGTIKVKEDGKIQLNSKDGNTEIAVGEAGTLPEGYPEDIVPIMEGSKITAALKSENDNKLNYSVVLYTDRSIQEAADYYEDVLKDAQNVGSMKTSDITTLGGEKGGYQVSVIVAPESDSSGKPGTSVALSLIPLGE